MADLAADHSSDGGSSSDLYDTAPTPQALSLSRPASTKRKPDEFDNDPLSKKARLDSPSRPSAHAHPSDSTNSINGHASNPRPASRPNIHHPLPGTWNSSRPGSVASAIGLPGPSVSTNPTNQRNQHEGNERKAARKADIEAKCLELDPPLLPNVLSRMNAFSAAIQIGLPLNDHAWETLKSKLLAERPAAEDIVREEERVIAQARADLDHSDADPKSEQRTSLKDSKDAEQREWAAAQAPMRDRLGPIADDYIRDHWSNGRSVTQENSPQFAADCLIHVRRKYFEPHPHNRDPIPGPLVLDAMKWVYDTKIKPIAETYRKDLFLCSDCDSGMKAFEGCIQHYAAKHTNTFSVGTQVVAWHTAPWPETTPFAPDPLKPRPAIPPSPVAYAPGQGAYYAAPHTHQPQPGYPPPPPPPPFGPQYTLPHQPLSLSHQASPAPYGSPTYGEQYQYYPHSPYGAPPYHGHIPPASPPNSHYPYHHPPPYTPVPSHGWPAPPYPPLYSPPSHGYGYPPPVQSPYVGMTAYGSAPAITHHTNAAASGQPGQNLYHAQREELANIAAEIWSSISDVKEIPPSVRVYTVMTQAVSHFRSRFKNEPSLDLVSDCLISNPLMSFLKNANGLACKTCVLNNEDLEEPHSSAFQFHSGGRKLYPFHSLLQHFRNVHVERDLARKSPPDKDSETPQRLDWKEDMIELPEDALIAGLANARNMDTNKLNVLAGAFPAIFPNYSTRRPSSSPSDSHGNEYDPRNPLMFASGKSGHSRDGSQGRPRVGEDDLVTFSPAKPSHTDYRLQPSHQDDYPLPPGHRNWVSTKDLGPSVVKLEDGEDYQLVPVGSLADPHRDRTPTRYVRVASSDQGYGSSVDAAAQFLEELQTEPRYRDPPQYARGNYDPSHSDRNRETITAGAPDEYRDPRAFPGHARAAPISRRPYHNEAVDGSSEYMYRPPQRALYHGRPQQNQAMELEGQYGNEAYVYQDSQILGVGRRGRPNHF